METIFITQDDFDIAGEYEALKQAGVGAVVIFSGVVRDNADNPRLLAMTLEHYPGMTEMEISTIIEAYHSQKTRVVVVWHDSVGCATRTPPCPTKC